MTMRRATPTPSGSVSSPRSMAYPFREYICTRARPNCGHMYVTSAAPTLHMLAERFCSAPHRHQRLLPWMMRSGNSKPHSRLAKHCSRHSFTAVTVLYRTASQPMSATPYMKELSSAHRQNPDSVTPIVNGSVRNPLRASPSSTMHSVS